jgi:hypothetical protein
VGVWRGGAGTVVVGVKVGLSRLGSASLQVVVAKSVSDTNVRVRREFPVGNLGRFAMFFGFWNLLN